MATERQIKSAKAVFDAYTRFLDSRDWNYTVRDIPGDDFMLEYGVSGDDLPMKFFLIVDSDRQVIALKSLQPVRFDKADLEIGAKAVCAINHRIFDGSFALDLEDGSIMWTVTAPFMGSLLSDEVFEYLLGVSAATVDEYNDKFLMLSKKLLDFDSFLTLVNK